MQPYETSTVTGLVRKNFNAEAALTEPVDDEKVSRVTVCPRVVRTDKPGSTARIPIRLCNMSAKILTFQPKTSICNLEEVKVLNRDPIKEMTAADAETKQTQDETKTAKSEMDFNLEGAALTSEQKEHVLDFLAKWKHVFSQGPTDIGRTNIVEHEIHLTDEHPFKEPFRKIPPALVEEVREHLKEMLESHT